MLRMPSLRMPIAAKAMLLIGVLGIMSTAANWYSLRSLHEIDRVNEVVIRKVAPTRVVLTEAKSAVESFGLATYKMAGSSDPTPSTKPSTNARGNLPRSRSGSKTWQRRCRTAAKT